MRLADAHCHLLDSAFSADLAEVIERARRAGVVYMVSSTLSIAEAMKHASMADSLMEAGVFWSIGLDPRLYPLEAEGVEELARRFSHKIAAIGEVGLDFKAARGMEERALQRRVFSDFISLALELGKPIVVHSRWSQSAVLDLLEEHRADLALLHAYTGSSREVERAAKLGYMISVSTSVTRHASTHRVAAEAPLECIVLESDSPALAPVAGERNEPANIALAAAEVARIRRVEATVVSEAAFENTVSFYSLPTSLLSSSRALDT